MFFLKLEGTRKRRWAKVLASQLFLVVEQDAVVSGLYYADFISFYSPTQLCGGGTTKSNSNELPISVPLSFCMDLWYTRRRSFTYEGENNGFTKF